MTLRLSGLALVLMALSGCASTQVDPPAAAPRIETLRAKLKDAEGPVMVVAHRACFADGAPENSLAGIEHCVALGVDMIEIDVALSADVVPVLMHDQTLERMTSMTGPVSGLPASQLVTLRLRSREGGPAEPFTDETVPTLRQALELAKDRILINLDVKGEAYAPSFEIVRELGMGDQIIMKMAAGADDAALIRAPFHGETHFMPIIRQCTEETRRGSCAPVLSQEVDGYDRYMPIAYEITFTEMEYFIEGIPRMLEKNRRIWVNTLERHHAAGLVDEEALTDPGAVWGTLIKLGASMIQTDHPRELTSYLQSEGLRERIP